MGFTFEHGYWNTPHEGGGSTCTTSIPCPANTSDPMMLVSGSFERGNTYLSNKKKLKKKYWLSFEKSWFPWGEPWFSPLTGTNFSIETRSNLNMKNQIGSRKSRFLEAQSIFFLQFFFVGKIRISSFQWAANEHHRITSVGAARNRRADPPLRGGVFQYPCSYYVSAP